MTDDLPTRTGAREPAHATLAVDCRCQLGEGIVWWARRGTLLWTDIEGARLWIADAKGVRNLAMPARLGSLAPCASGALLLGLEYGLFRAHLDDTAPDGMSLQRLLDVEADQPSTRLNDGRTDREGNFVFGTMNRDDGHPATGSFYQWSTAAGLRRLDLPKVGIANSICFSPDGATMYFCDSPRRQIMTCRYDAGAAAVTHVELFAELGPSDGFPDGSIVDAEGHLWNAAWGAGVVRRYRPDGSIEREVSVPAKNPTCPVFGGDGLNELYVTTAREEMSPSELERTPEAGGVYRAVFDDVRGLADRPFADTSMINRARLRIAIDMDDTMADAMGEHLRRYNAAFGASMTADDLHGRNLEEWCPPAHREAAFDMLDASFFAGLAILPDCETVVRELSERHDVYIVSAAMDVPTSFEAKFLWLQRHFPFIPPTRMVFCGDKGIIDTDYLIDDQPRHFETFRGRPLLFSAPHNAHEARYTRVNSWSEVRDFFARLGP